ncbi:MAG: hypothetical protein EB090_05555 [Verrucomicrobia bacterium]|nr:hypothetical protein [Verrucomicrobiota bacterium]
MKATIPPKKITAQERAFESMRSQGLRMTSQRRAITEVAFGSKDHFTAEALLARSRQRDPKVSRATVYRTLAFLDWANNPRNMTPILPMPPDTDTSCAWTAAK